MISVITPLSRTGNQYIMEAYESLCKQTYSDSDWEWLILENNGGRLPREPFSDKRVKVFKDKVEPNIGALKAFLCSKAQGNIIVELDHDDILAAHALASVEHALRDADFAYSNFAEFHDETWEPNIYAEEYGWKTREVGFFQGHELVSMVAPPVTPQNLRLIDWAPNHIRAWRKSAYEEVGGHNEAMKFGDDHDLVVRFFLAGKRFKHIDDCLYFYRVHDANNVKTSNEEIRQLTWAVYNRRIWALADRFVVDNDLLRVDLCGGINPIPGYFTLDKVLPRGVEGRKCNLDKTWKLRDNSAGILRAYDALEHLGNPVHVMNEAYRVLAPGGFFMIMVPSTDGRGAFQDPTHRSFWNQNSFWYYSDRDQSKFIPDFKGRFQVAKLITFFPTEWHQQNFIPYVEAHLLALKPGYEPYGEVRI